MDSVEPSRYAEAMQSLRFLVILAGATLISITSATARADEVPVLAVLEYSGGLLPKRVEIRATKGKAKSFYTNLPRAFWTLREGDTIKQEFAPRGRVIQFLRSAGSQPQPVCSVVVRYVRAGNGWRPTYLLEEPMAVMWQGDQRGPTPNAGGAREPMQVVNRSDPNTRGFYRTLSFGSTAGLSRIDAWIVQ